MRRHDVRGDRGQLPGGVCAAKRCVSFPIASQSTGSRIANWTHRLLILLFSTLTENKLGYRYPRGESYLDVISRLDPLVQELESYQEPVLIVGHQGVLRLIYAYFTGMDRTEACNASIPLNTVRVHLYLYLHLYFRTSGQLVD